MRILKKVKLTSDNVANIISLIALLIGLLALYFAWQANRVAEEANDITRKQVSPQIVALSSDFAGGGLRKNESKTYYDVWCRQRIQITNLGGAATSLIGFEATAHYQDSELVVAANEESVISTRTLDGRIRNMRFSFFDPMLMDYSQGDLSQVSSGAYLRFPMQIDAFTTVEVNTIVNFILEGSYTMGEIEQPMYEYQYKYPQSFYGLPPLEVSYTLHLASAEEITTSPTLCLFLE